MRTVGDIVVAYKKAIREFPEYKGRIYVNIDDTGLGGGVTDRLKEVKKEQRLGRLVIIGINMAEKIETDTKAGKEAAEFYDNLTTHMWACFRDLLDSGDVSLDPDDETCAQLSVRKYTVASNGKLRLESKEEMKKRGLDSPDRGDAITLSTYLGKIKKYTGTAPGREMGQSLSKENEFSV